MANQTRTIAEMLEATASRHDDCDALGFARAEYLEWWSWRNVRTYITTITEQIRSSSLLHNKVKAEGYIGVPTEDFHLVKKHYGHTWLGLDIAGSNLQKIVATAGSIDNVPYPLDLIATIVPTSGTSGDLRFVALSHENLVSNTIAVADTIAGSLDEDPRDEVRLSFLPFSHLYARVCDLYCWVYRGSKLVLAESRDTIFRDCQLAKPTAINGVPYFFQKVIDLADREKTSIKKLLGGEIRRCYSGGAALSPEIEQRFWDEGVPLLNGYGLSEASPVVTVSTIKDYKLGTVGKPLPGVDVRIADDGEVLVRGPNVMMGYWSSGMDGGPDGIDEAATAEVLRDGWLHTGDLGSLDPEGFLTIHGRKKETLVLSTGKNVSPSRIEALLAASPWIEQCAVVGDNRKHLAAVIVPNPDRVRAEVKRQRLWVWSKKSALRHPAIRSIFEQEIAERLDGLPSHEQIRKFTLLPRGFSKEKGEMTEKLSLRRGVMEKRLSREIGAMYR